MKKSIVLILIVFYSGLSFSQWNSEYDYFSLKVGATHTLFSKQPAELPNKMLISPEGDHLQLVPTKGVKLNYVPGYYGTLIYNHDLKKGNSGISIGIDYRTYGIAANYETTFPSGTTPAPEIYKLREVYNVSQISLPVYLKYGKKFYKTQKYIYAGVSYSYNLFLSKSENVSYNETIKRSQPEKYKDMMKTGNFAGIVGFNYMFLNFEANYVVGNFLSKNYEDATIGVKPFAGYPKGTFFIKTGLNIPLNSWTTRKVYAAEMWLRRLLR